MYAYSRIKNVGTKRSKSLDLTNLPPHTPTSSKPKDNKPNPNITRSNTTTRLDPSRILEQDHGEVFGVILGRKYPGFSDSSTLSDEKQRMSSFHSVVKGSFSMRRSASVAEGYRRMNRCCCYELSTAVDENDLYISSAKHNSQKNHVKKRGKLFKVDVMPRQMDKPHGLKIIQSATPIVILSSNETEPKHSMSRCFCPTMYSSTSLRIIRAEVYSGLLYRLRNSPPDRYACLVAEPKTNSFDTTREVVGVVDVTVLREDSILQHLPGAEEYLYVSGITVLNKSRRQKAATKLLKACTALSAILGFKYLVLRAYEDDHGGIVFERGLQSSFGRSSMDDFLGWKTKACPYG